MVSSQEPDSLIKKTFGNRLDRVPVSAMSFCSVSSVAVLRCGSRWGAVTVFLSELAAGGASASLRRGGRSWDGCLCERLWCTSLISFWIRVKKKKNCAVKDCFRKNAMPSSSALRKHSVTEATHSAQPSVKTWFVLILIEFWASWGCVTPNADPGPVARVDKQTHVLFKSLWVKCGWIRRFYEVKHS